MKSSEISKLLIIPRAKDIDLGLTIGDQPCVVIADENTAELCSPLLDLPEHHTFVVKAGEKHKSLKSAKKIWQRMIKYNLSRNTYVVNLGGGVITDLGGFSASLYKRGMPFINVPTTLLGMVDAAIGGKVAINFDKLKNYIGVFNFADLIIICPEFLNTLPRREIRCGYAEMLKHGLIADLSHWREVSKGPLVNFEIPSTELIEQSINIKTSIVKEDYNESNLRKVLNFGHTIGHAIEALFARDHNHISHGDAVAAGMICEAFLSSLHLGLSTDELEEITDVITESFGKIILNRSDFDVLVDLAMKDKKSISGELNFTLLRTIGEASINNKVDRSSVIQGLQYYDSL